VHTLLKLQVQALYGLHIKTTFCLFMMFYLALGFVNETVGKGNWEEIRRCECNVNMNKEIETAYSILCSCKILKFMDPVVNNRIPKYNWDHYKMYCIYSCVSSFGMAKLSRMICFLVILLLSIKRQR